MNEIDTLSVRQLLEEKRALESMIQHPDRRRQMSAGCPGRPQGNAAIGATCDTCGWRHYT